MDLPAHPLRPAQRPALLTSELPWRAHASRYPEALAPLLRGRDKKALGDAWGLANFGVNLVRLAPGAMTALRHAHLRQDEFVYVLQGHPTLHTDQGAQVLQPHMCVGFPAGSGNAHHLVNASDAEVLLLEVGDRSAGDRVIYPEHDLQAHLSAAVWQFLHTDGQPY